MRDSFYLDLDHQQVYIRCFGQGPRLLLAFHGFAETGELFAGLEEPLGADYTILAPDLPFHGLTQWDKRHFTSRDLGAMVSHLLKHAGLNRFTLLGYSMGGRVALSIAETRLLQLDQLVLLAPEGLKENGWYSLATKTWMGRQLFRYFTHHPRAFYLLLKTGHHLKWVNESLYKFVFRQIHDEAGRTLVYRVWTGMKQIKPDMARLSARMLEQGLSVHIFFGRYDRVIPSETGKVLATLPHCHIEVVDKGHNLMDATMEKTLEQLLAKDKTET